MEESITSLPSNIQPTAFTEPPTRLSRWWMRHHQHIGLASMAGSAILVCIAGVILLPIFFREAPKEDEPCSITSIPNLTKPPRTTIGPVSTTAFTTLDTTRSPTSTPAIAVDPLCAATAVWNSEAVTVAGLLTGVSSSLPTGLKGPNDVLVDGAGNLFVADSDNNRVAYWPFNATQGRVVMGTGAIGSWSNLFKYAAALVAWKGQLYVSDLGNFRIMAFPMTTMEGAPDGVTIIGREGLGSSLNQINQVYAMAVDEMRERFYLSDFRNHRILLLNLTNNTMQLAAGTGLAGVNDVSLNFPGTITVDQSTGSFYVADTRNHRIQQFAFNSTQGITVAGGMSNGSNLTQLNLPWGVALDPSGNVYVADTGNHRIIQWLAAAQRGRVIAGTGVAGSNSTQLNSPVQLKWDAHHNLYVVDQKNNRIQRFDLLRSGC